MKGWKALCVSGDIDGKDPQGQKGINGSQYCASHSVLNCFTVLASTLCAPACKRHCDRALFSVKANDQCLGVSKSSTPSKGQ